MPPGTKDLSALVRKAQELAGQVDKGDVANLQGLHVHRTMAQVLEEAQELHRRASRQQPDTAAVNAQILHARHGLDVSQFGQQLPTLRWGIDATVPTPTSIEGFLKTERQTALMTAIQKSQKNTSEQFHRRSFESMMSVWEAEKEEVREILGVGPILERLDTTTQSLTGATRSMQITGMQQGATSLDMQMSLYAKAVAELSDAVLREAPCNIIQKFREVCNATEDARKKDIDSCWSIVDGLVGREGSQTLARGHFLQGPYASDRRRAEMTKTLINNAKDTLQRRYIEFMDAHVRSNNLDDRAAASAGSYEGIRDFVHSRRVARSSETWACIYYAIRCGNVRVARQFAERELSPEDQPVVGLLDDAVRGALPKSHAWCMQQYIHCRKSGGDPYKRAVINVLGRCEPAEDIHSEIAINIEDFLWVKLNLIRADVQDPKIMIDDFVHLQRLISITHGEAHFQADQRPLRYFTVLLFTAQFEKAIEFLRHRDLRLAVHFAIALAHYGALRVARVVSDPMLTEVGSSKDGEQVLNYGLLVQRYVRLFARTDSGYALRYYHLLSDVMSASSERGVTLFEQCLCDLVIETCEWTTILGELDVHGRKKAAQIDIFFGNNEEAKRRIILHVAQETEKKGRILDALRLYDLADNRPATLILLCRNLSQEAAVRPAPAGSNREDLRQFAQYIKESARYEVPPRDCNDAGAYHDLRKTVPVLLKLYTFFDAFFNERFDEALRLAESMRDLNIVPVSLDHVPLCVNNFEGLSEEVRRNLPQMLLFIMISLDNQYKLIRAGTQGFVRNDATKDGGREQAVQRVRDKARAIVTYAGQITFRLPGLTNAELIRIEVGLML